MDRSLLFWQNQRASLPHQSKVAAFCFTLAPSSAAAERVFSILKQFFTLNQLQSSLQEDYTESAIMLQFNASK
jgi:hypothetical protein